MVEVRVSYRIQRVGLVDTTGELLCNFALSIYDALPVALQDQLGEPDEGWRSVQDNHK
jgi:hypothetical protein